VISVTQIVIFIVSLLIYIALISEVIKCEISAVNNIQENKLFHL
jgi:hypothetical protein